MPTSDRSVFTKARLIALSCAFAGAVCLAVIGWGLLQSAEYQRQADYQAAQYAEYTHDHVGYGCVSGTVLDKTNCVAEASDKRRAYERDEQDLVAQRQSALWAYIMGAAAVVGVGLSAVGVWLVWTTFAETRRANEIANSSIEQGQLGLRAWVYANQGMGVQIMGAEPMIVFYIDWVNAGETPAVRVSSFQRLVPNGGEFNDSGAERQNIIGPDRSFRSSLIMVPLRHHAEAREQRFAGYCVYNDIFSTEDRVTNFEYIIQAPAMPFLAGNFVVNDELVNNVMQNIHVGVIVHTTT